jgi:hypothetical protein
VTLSGKRERKRERERERERGERDRIMNIFMLINLKTDKMRIFLD